MKKDTTTKALTQKGTWETFNNYTHPTYTEKANGLYKITVNSLGHVSGTAAVAASDLPSHTHSYLPLSGGSMTGGLTLKGADAQLGTTNSSTNDSGDIVFLYGNGNEKIRIWTDNEYTTKTAPNFRMYNSSGTALYNGTLVLGDGTGASGTWNITANKLKIKSTNRHASSFKTWTAKTWSGLTNFYGGSVWTDGDNIYYSSGTEHCVLDKSSEGAWKSMSWPVLTSFEGNNVWTDGTNIYYSSGTTHYVLTEKSVRCK